MEEGYVKFKAEWEMAPPPDERLLTDLMYWRCEMYSRGLIGAYSNGTGFGNISCRLDAAGAFLISGSATGCHPTLLPSHFTTVMGFDLEENTVYCKGPVMASSESMSHAVIYRHCLETGGVIHVHHRGLWERMLHRVPTTDEGATYGSPEMASSIIQLLQKTDLSVKKIFVMQSHPEGIFSFGRTLEEAARILLSHWKRFC